MKNKTFTSKKYTSNSKTEEAGQNAFQQQPPKYGIGFVDSSANSEVIQRVKGPDGKEISNEDLDRIDRVRRYFNGENSRPTAQDLDAYNRLYRTFTVSAPLPAVQYGAVPADPNADNPVYENIRIPPDTPADPGDARTNLLPQNIQPPDPDVAARIDNWLLNRRG